MNKNKKTKIHSSQSSQRKKHINTTYDGSYLLVDAAVEAGVNATINGVTNVARNLIGGTTIVNSTKSFSDNNTSSNIDNFKDSSSNSDIGKHLIETDKSLMETDDSNIFMDIVEGIGDGLGELFSSL